MSYPTSGVYKIKNVDTGTYLRVEGASTVIGTPIVGYQDDGQAANLWQAIVDGDTGIITLQTALADAFIQTQDDGVSAGTYLVLGGTAVEFQLVSNGNDEYRIHLTEDTNMVFNLAKSANNTKESVTIEVNNNDSNNQLWSFIED